jgi:hypothetical protein
LRPGVYHCRRGTDVIRVVVAAELPREERNALLYLFSASPEQVQYGAEHYRVQSPNTSTIVNKVFKEYRMEGLPMPYSIEDFRREVAREVIDEMTSEERLEFVKRLSPAERLAGLPPEDRLAGMSPEDRLAGMSPAEIEAYLKSLSRKSPTARTRKSKRRR